MSDRGERFHPKLGSQTPSTVYCEFVSDQIGVSQSSRIITGVAKSTEIAVQGVHMKKRVSQAIPTTYWCFTS